MSGDLDLALRLLAVDPAGLRGLVLRARAGPVREKIVAALAPDWPRLHPAIDDVALFGGPDIAATLAAGRVVMRAGLLGGPPRDVILTMAERVRPALAGRLATALDAGALGRVLMLDEGVEDERAPDALRDRVAFVIRAEGLRDWTPPDLEAARAASARLASVRMDGTCIETLVGVAASFGIGDMRLPLFALRAARALAALEGADAVDEETLARAASLVLDRKSVV